MITVYAFEPGLGMPSASPFVTKAMILLKMADQRFGIEILHDLSNAPKGKLPYIHDGDKVIADSDMIRRYLESRCQVDFDHGLNDAERASGLALTRLAEEHLYWCSMYSHWQVDAHWSMIKQQFFGGLPDDQRDAIADAVREQILRDLQGQGMGRHDYQEVVDFAREDLKVIAAQLGQQPFLFGDEPKSADAAIGPQLLTLAADPISSPLTEAIHEQKELFTYARRVSERFFPGFFEEKAAALG